MDDVNWSGAASAVEPDGVCVLCKDAIGADEYEKLKSSRSLIRHGGCLAIHVGVDIVLLDNWQVFVSTFPASHDPSGASAVVLPKGECEMTR